MAPKDPDENPAVTTRNKRAQVGLNGAEGGDKWRGSKPEDEGRKNDALMRRCVLFQAACWQIKAAKPAAGCKHALSVTACMCVHVPA